MSPTRSESSNPESADRHTERAVVATIDIGTNSTRLLVTDGLRDLHRQAVVTGLGRGLGPSGAIGEEAIERTCATLAAYRETAADLGATALAAVTTAAARSASNTAEFLVAATDALGVTPRVISGEEEARLSYRGATSDLDGGDWTVVDIGGGSTEVVSEGSTVSLPVGSVRLTESFFDAGPADPGVVTAAFEAARAFFTECPVAARLAGVAGTWTSLAAMEGAVEPYEADLIHHSVLARSQVDRWVERLASLPVAERAATPGLDPARAPVILGGAVVAAAVMDRLADEVVISERDLLDGLAAETWPLEWR